MTCSPACENSRARKRDPVTLLAAAVASGSTNSTLNDIEPGALGFLVVAGIGIILVFLLRSMNKHLRSVQSAADAGAEAAEGTAGEQPPGPVVAGTVEPAGTVQTADAVQTDTVQTDTVQTGDPKQDKRAEGSAKRG